MRRTAGRTPAELERLIEQAAQSALCRATLSQLVIDPTLLLSGEGSGDAGDKEMDLDVDIIIEEKDIKAAEKDMAAVTPSSVPTPKVRFC